MKINLISASNFIHNYSLPTKLTVVCHLYNDNAREAEEFSRWTKAHGVDFMPYAAFFGPVERLVDILENKSPVTSEDSDVLDRLLLPIHKLSKCISKLQQKPCTLMHDQIAMDHRGDIYLCCATYLTTYRVGNVLSDSIENIQNIRVANSFCKRCELIGGSYYYTREEEIYEAYRTLVRAHRV